MLRKKNAGPTRVAIICFHKIGDSVFTIPALQVLSKLKPGHVLRVFCYQENQVIYKLVLNDFKYTVISKEDIYFNRFFNLKARKELLSYNPDIILDLTGTILSASLIIGAKCDIYGLTQFPYQAIFRRWVTKRKIPHLIDVCLDALSTFVDVPEDDTIKMFPEADNTGTHILIHPGAGWAAKEWGAEKYYELSEQLEKCGYECKLISCEGNNIENIKNSAKVRIKKTKDLPDLIRSIQECSAFIGNDSGALYIANLLGKPTFTIYGPTNPYFSKPYGDRHSFIQKCIKCSPLHDEQYCYTDAGRKGCGSFECMKQLKVEVVLASIIEFLRNNKIQLNA